METVFAIIFFVLFFGGMGWFIWRQIRNDRRRRAELEALAQVRGWTLDRSQEGRQQIVSISPPGGDWWLKLAYPYSRNSGKTKSRIPGHTEFRAKAPAWPDGRVVFVSKMPGGFGQLAGGVTRGFVGLMQNSIVRGMLSKVVPPEILDDLDRLQPFEPPPGIELTILATEDPRGGDLQAVHEAVQGWRPIRNRDGSPPMVSIGPEGTSMRLSSCLSEAEDIAHFVDHATALAERLA